MPPRVGPIIALGPDPDKGVVTEKSRVLRTTRHTSPPITRPRHDNPRCGHPEPQGATTRAARPTGDGSDSNGPEATNHEAGEGLRKAMRATRPEGVSTKLRTSTPEPELSGSRSGPRPGDRCLRGENAASVKVGGTSTRESLCR
jgi:hypothetical protein